MTAATLVFGWGNPSRGDDALGPCCVEAIAALCPAHPEWGAVECLTDFQLQVEHALDLAGRRRVIFVDAQAKADDVVIETLAPRADASLSSHALSPQALLHVAARLGQELPQSALLRIGGKDFGLGAPLSPTAERNLSRAIALAAAWLTD